MTDVPQAAIDAAVKANYAFFDADGDIKHPPNTWVHELARVMLEAAAPHLAAAGRETCAQLAESLKFTLYRPGNGPGAGHEALDVVPLGELLGHLRKDHHAAA